MEQKGQPSFNIIYLILGVLLVFLLIRIPIFQVVLLRVLMIGVVAGILYGGYRLFLYLQNRIKENKYRDSPEGRIKSKIDSCQELLKKNQEEIDAIRQNIADLERKINATSDISSHYQKESEELLAAFRSELNLRKSKADFYRRSIQKLQSLLQNHQLSREIEEKKKSLAKFQENNFEELAKLEEIKSDLEIDSYYLDTIDELSVKMLESTNVDDAEHLRLELEEMTRELDEL